MQTATSRTALDQANLFDSQSLAGKALLAIGASLFVAACAHVSVPLPFTPVPLTLGNFAVVLVGLALGPATAFAAMVLYLVEGALGAPVFNPGAGGVAQLIGATGGYLFSYPFAAALAGLLMRVRRSFGMALVASAAATVLTLLAGASWLATVLHLAPAIAFAHGVAPFLPGEIVKVTAAAGIVSAFARWRRA